MQVTLMSNAHCATAWGFRDGLEFTRDGSDEMLRELVMYLSSRASRRGWTWEMVYYEEYNTKTDDRRVVNLVTDRFGKDMWQFRNIYRDDTEVFDELQRLTRVKVLFSRDKWLFIKASVCYMTCCETLQGFYYLSFFKWATRFSSADEGLMLFDAMAANIDLIIDAANRDEVEVCFEQHMHPYHVERISQRVSPGVLPLTHIIS
jgi:hypothetical protein